MERVKAKVLVNLRGTEGLFLRGRIFEGEISEFPETIQDEIRIKSKTIEVVVLKPEKKPEPKVTSKVESEPEHKITPELESTEEKVRPKSIEKIKPLRKPKIKTSEK